nr:DEAD/DEAH box helicase [Candidatus Cloacimonadota bacterium]
MKEIIKISVGELAEYAFQSGDLNLEVFTSSNRAVSGIRVHQKIQRSRPEEYQKEVFISRQFETENFIVEINGRIDGIFVFPDKTIIEEIKTTERKLEYYQNNENPVHRAQVNIYAYLYAIANDLKEIETHLTYYRLETKEIREFTKIFSKNELEDFFNLLFDKFLKWTNRLFEYKNLRNESIQNLKFPFEKYRLGQHKMATEVYKTVRDSGQLIVQAPTGIGKTLAVIFPAIKSFPEKYTTKIFYLTPKTTGKEVAEKAFRKMNENGLIFKFLTLTAKDKICFNPENACNGEECKFARGFYDRIDDALNDIFSENSLTREI